jgi:hypothetical protein
LQSNSKETEIVRILDMRDAVLFAGSGLSIWSGLPNWSELIERLIAFVETRTGSEQTAARRSFMERDFLVAAEHLLRRINRAEFIEFLRADLGFSAARPHQIHELFAQLGPTCIITTNYDQLIETQFLKSGHNPLRVITNRQVADFADIVRADAKDFVFKIHGSIDDSASIVLSESDYFSINPSSFVRQCSSRSCYRRSTDLSLRSSTCS